MVDIEVPGMEKDLLLPGLIQYAKDNGMTVQDAADHILKAIYAEGRQKYES